MFKKQNRRPNKRRLAAYIKECAAVLEINTKIVIGDDHHNAQAWAVIELPRSLDGEAFLTFDPDFWGLPAAVKRELVAHELLHLALWPLTRLSPETDITLEAEERVIYTLQGKVAKSLPAWPRSTKRKG